MTVKTDAETLTIVVSHKSDEPIYEQIERQFRREIMTGKMEEGDPLPSLRQLAKELRVSVVTANRAYEDLEKEGFIVTAPGRGAFVARVSKEALNDKKLQLVEEKLREAIDLAESYGISRADFLKMANLLFPG
jgi:GntR family transcriptional regulator